MIGRRLSRLKDATNRTLLLAAVIGREFSLDVLGPLVEVGEDDLLDTLEQAAGAGIIAEVPGTAGRFAFTHALMRETLYEELSTTRRVRLHRRVANVLEALPRPVAPADLAYHFAESAPGGDIDRAIGYAVQAGETAAAGLAHEEAARFFEMALHVAELKPTGSELRRLRVDLHGRRARAFASIGLWLQARPEFTAALEHLEPDAVEQRAELLLSLTTTVFFLMDMPEVKRLALEALELSERSGRDDLAADAMAWLGRVHQSDGDLDETLAMDRRALARAGGRFGVALAQAPLSFYWVGRAAEGVELGRAAAEFARRSSDSTLTMFALPHFALTLVGCGRYAEAVRVFDEARQFGERHGMRPLLARTIAMSAGFRQELFDFDGAEALSQEARETALSAGFVPPAVSAGIDLLLNYARRQDPDRGDRLVAEVEETVARAGGWHGWLWRLRLTQARAELALARGKWDEAIQGATSTIEQGRARRRLKYQACGFVTRADAHAALGQVREARADLASALELARSIDDPALVLRVLSALLRVDGTDALATEARRMVTRIAAALPQDSVRQRFEAADEVRGIARH